MNTHDTKKPAPDSQLVRINKAIAQAGICSRRKADDLIIQGKVEVNGATITSPGIKIDPVTDTISVDGSPIPTHENPSQTYLLLNKPVGIITTAHDPQGRTTVLDLLPEQYRKKRVFPVGRLDIASQGLLLLTTDGPLTQRMTHPGYNHPKTYEVVVLGNVTQDTLGCMSQGMTLAEGQRLRPVEVKVIRKQGNKTTLSMILRQGVNRQIRRMCRDLGLKVVTLKRIQQGPLHLGKLKPGTFRELTPNEIKQLTTSLNQPPDCPNPGGHITLEPSL